MTELYFIRHGETEANVKGILTGIIETNLTEKGIKSAKELTNKLNIDFDYYYCSPLKRTHQTLKAIKGNVNFYIDERLIEVSSGDWQGKLKSDLPEYEYNLYKKCLLDPPNGERLEDVDKRIKSFLDEIFNKYQNNEKILIVTHNAFLRNLKRMFVDEVNEPKNLEIFLVTSNMYEQMEGKIIDWKQWNK